MSRSRRPDKFLWYILPQIDGTPEEDESSKFSFTVFMTTESYTSASLMSTRNLRTMCQNFKNDNGVTVLVYASAGS